MRETSSIKKAAAVRPAAEVKTIYLNYSPDSGGASSRKHKSSLKILYRYTLKMPINTFNSKTSFWLGALFFGKSSTTLILHIPAVKILSVNMIQCSHF